MFVDLMFESKRLRFRFWRRAAKKMLRCVAVMEQASRGIRLSGAGATIGLTPNQAPKAEAPFQSRQAMLSNNRYRVLTAAKWRVGPYRAGQGVCPVTMELVLKVLGVLAFAALAAGSSVSAGRAAEFAVHL